MIILLTLTLVAIPKQAHAKSIDFSADDLIQKLIFLKPTPQPVWTFTIATPTPTPEPVVEQVVEDTYTYEPIYKADLGSGGQSRYFWGQCVWYVAGRRPDLPGPLGNAKDWLSNARSNGIATGSVPQAGAVVSLAESWYGHVAYVESLGDGTINISEMNVQGLGVLSYRTLSVTDWRIQGYIY